MLEGIFLHTVWLNRGTACLGMLLILVRLVNFVVRCTGLTLALSLWWNSWSLIGQLLLHYAGTREGAEFALVQRDVSLCVCPRQHCTHTRVLVWTDRSSFLIFIILCVLFVYHLGSCQLPFCPAQLCILHYLHYCSTSMFYELNKVELSSTVHSLQRHKMDVRPTLHDK